MRFSDKKFFWVGRKVENQVKTFAEDGCTHCFNKYEIPEDFLFLLGFSAVLAGRRDQLYKLWGDSCSYTSQISSVPSESLILTTQVSCNCFTLNSIQNFQNIKHIITAAYESVRARHSSHLFVGIISPSHWASATESVLKLGLPWRVLRPQLVSSTKNGMVDYQEWMKELSITEPKLEVTHLFLTYFPSAQSCKTMKNVWHPKIQNMHLVLTDIRYQPIGDDVQKPLQPGNYLSDHRHRSLRLVNNQTLSFSVYKQCWTHVLLLSLTVFFYMLCYFCEWVKDLLRSPPRSPTQYSTGLWIFLSLLKVWSLTRNFAKPGNSWALISRQRSVMMSLQTWPRASILTRTEASILMSSWRLSVWWTSLHIPERMDRELELHQLKMLEGLCLRFTLMHNHEKFNSWGY